MDASFASSRLGGCRLLQHKYESKQEELQMEVKCVLDGLGEILVFVDNVFCKGNDMFRII